MFESSDTRKGILPRGYALRARRLLTLLPVAALGLAAACGSPPPVAPSPPVPAGLSDSGAAPAEPADSSGPAWGCGLFPADHIWNVEVDTLPVDSESEAYVESIGPEDELHPDFGSGQWDGGPIGIPYVEVDAATRRVPVTFEYSDESDPGPYPIPVEPPIEGGPASDGDRHVLLWDRRGCRLHELYAAFPRSDGSWRAGSGAIYDLRDYGLRPEGWTSADAAGLPILPGLVRYDEVAAGEIRHALRFTAPRTRRAYVWPARHFASDDEDVRLPPMGQRLRLRAGFDLAGFSPELQVILRALKVYGMMLADNGSAWFLSGAPDDRWDDDALHELNRVQGSDFEAVDVSGLQLDADSGRTR
ncbi:MAG: hypothetical protein ACRDHY_00110 [Anaerolineales bacterium]